MALMSYSVFGIFSHAWKESVVAIGFEAVCLIYLTIVGLRRKKFSDAKLSLASLGAFFASWAALFVWIIVVQIECSPPGSSLF
jgi:hypothetical protein